VSEVETNDDNDIVYKMLGSEHPISKALMIGERVLFHDVILSMLIALNDRLIAIEQKVNN
jgi:hypothetical protein